MTEQSNTSVSNNKNSTSNESINTDVNTIANSANDSIWNRCGTGKSETYDLTGTGNDSQL